MKTNRIGLFGLGCVGLGLYQLLQATGSADLSIYKVVVKDPDKPRLIPPELLSLNANDILENDSIDLVVEAIDDADAAWEIVSAALRKGKPVVTANKKMVATHLQQLTALQQETGTPLLYEAAVCGAIPIVRSIDNYFSNEPIRSLSGIFNGTSNYILSKIFNERLDYSLALKQAQDLGFAETDPTADVGGFDAKYKLIILALHAFGIVLQPSRILNIGIDRLSGDDIQYARKNGWKIRLVPALTSTADGVTGYVIPRFVKTTERLFGIENEHNAVEVESVFSGTQFFTGKGAGAFPTAAAVLADLRDIARGRRYDYTRLSSPASVLDSSQVQLEIYLRYSDPALVKALNFSTISEGTLDGRYKHVTGYVSLDSLLKCNALIVRDTATVIHTGQSKVIKKSILKEELVAESQDL